MAPATAASKYRSTWAFSAAWASSPVDTASRALFAVTTDLPCSSADRIALRDGSTGPITSTTMSTSSRVTSASMSSVSRSAGTPRSSATRRTPMPRSTSGAPMRAARSSALSSMMRTTSLPTLPSPNTATPTGFSSVHHQLTSLPDSADRRPSPCAGSDGTPRRARPPPRGGRSSCNDSTANSNRRRSPRPRPGHQALCRRAPMRHGPRCRHSRNAFRRRGRASARASVVRDTRRTS